MTGTLLTMRRDVTRRRDGDERCANARAWNSVSPIRRGLAWQRARHGRCYSRRAMLRSRCRPGSGSCGSTMIDDDAVGPRRPMHRGPAARDAGPRAARASRSRRRPRAAIALYAVPRRRRAAPRWPRRVHGEHTLVAIREFRRVPLDASSLALTVFTASARAGGRSWPHPRPLRRARRRTSTSRRYLLLARSLRGAGDLAAADRGAGPAALAGPPPPSAWTTSGWKSPRCSTARRNATLTRRSCARPAGHSPTPYLCSYAILLALEARSARPLPGPSVTVIHRSGGVRSRAPRSNPLAGGVTAR